jgi:hypothetical protein
MYRYDKLSNRVAALLFNFASNKDTAENVLYSLRKTNRLPFETINILREPAKKH